MRVLQTRALPLGDGALDQGLKRTKTYHISTCPRAWFELVLSFALVIRRLHDHLPDSRPKKLRVLTRCTPTCSACSTSRMTSYPDARGHHLCSPLPYHLATAPCKTSSR